MDQFSIRDELERIIKDLNIERDDFREVEKNQWLDILNKTEESFLHKKHFSNNLHRGWEVFNKPQYSLRFINEDGYKYIPNLIDEEYVWFIAEDDKDKMWVYEVCTAFISDVIAECMQLREYYLVSKEYEWILCENHHGVLCGSGNRITGKMRAFKELYSERIY